MIYLPHPFSTPEENLAADEALLEVCDQTPDHPGFLRFYESAVYFVVLGYGKTLAAETYREACAALKFPILRRCSGGGTVLQGPGCFNYALVLPLTHHTEVETITGANRYIMSRIRAVVESISPKPIEVHGFTDLVLAGRKFSGNAQRRKQRALLFHGSFLLDFDLQLISKTLRMPEQQPEYRARRAHADFLINAALDRERLEARFVAAWNGVAQAASPEMIALTERLVREKYSRPEWNERH